MRAQHRDVVGDGFRVRRADADVDHRDAAAVGTHQVVGRHLRQARRRGAEVVARLRRQALAARDHVAGFNEGAVVLRPRRRSTRRGLIGSVSHRLVTEPHELVDVELVVREQHEILEMLRRSAGVVTQPVQRVVDPRRGEQRQRLRFARAGFAGAVGDAVVHRVQVGQVETVAHQQTAFGGQVALDVVVVGEREMHRNRMGAGAHFERDVVVLQQQAELLEVVAREQVGPGQRGFEGAGAGDEAIAQARVGAHDGVGAHAHDRIARAHALGHCVTSDERLQCATQVLDAALVDGAHLSERSGRVGEGGGGDVVRNDKHVSPFFVIAFSTGMGDRPDSQRCIS